jgi:hypothetical protein
VFNGDVNFQGSTFEYQVRFGGLRFMKAAYFVRTVFRGHARFFNSAFEGYVSFGGGLFDRSVAFDNVKFYGNAHFGGTTFNRQCYLVRTEFRGRVSFRDMNVERYATYREVTFEGNVFFTGSTFAAVEFIRCSVAQSYNLHYEWPAGWCIDKDGVAIVRVIASTPTAGESQNG